MGYMTTFLHQAKTRSELRNQLEKKEADKIIFILSSQISETRLNDQSPLIPVAGQLNKSGQFARGYVITKRISNNQMKAQTTSVSSDYELKVSPAITPGNDHDIKVSLLQLRKLDEYHKGTHENLSVFGHSTDKKIILKSIKKNSTNSMNEVMALVHLQVTTVTPYIYFILETDEVYAVYMEMIFPGVTLEKIIEKIPSINTNTVVKFVHSVFYQLIQCMKKIWGSNWTHKDIHAGNIMLEASNQCINIKIIDCGNAINDATNDQISKDIIQFYDLLCMLLEESPKIDFGLNEFKQMKYENRTLDKIEELKSKVTELAVIFGIDRAANKEIVEMISKIDKGEDGENNTSCCFIV